jgi:hypothetical protein
MIRPLSLVAVPDAQRRPLTDEEGKGFVNLGFAERRDPGRLIPAAELRQYLGATFGVGLSDSFIVQLIVSRLEQGPPEYTYSPYAVALTAILTDRPGVAVMWAYTLFDESRKGTPLTIERFAQDLFAWGVPTDKGYHDIWDAQKGFNQTPRQPFDNWLDKADVWKAKESAPA